MLLSAILALSTINSQDLIQAVDSARLKATVTKLASWNTRNTSSKEVTEAAEWLAAEYRKIPGVEVELWKYTIPAGRRVPVEKEVVQVVATLKGETDQRILVGGHLDTINVAQGADPLTARAPGANDDASGTALALECARVLERMPEWAMRLVRGLVIFVVGAIFAVPFAALMLIAFPARDPGSEVAGLRMLALYLLGYLLSLAIGVLLSKKLFDVVWKLGSDRD